MNPYAILAAVALWGASIWCAINTGRDLEIATQAREEKVAAVAYAAAASAAANAISKLKVKHTTVNNKLETEVREKPVFRECRSGSAAVELFNSSIEPVTLAASSRGLVPAKDAPAQ